MKSNEKPLGYIVSIVVFGILGDYVRIELRSKRDIEKNDGNMREKIKTAQRNNHKPQKKKKTHTKANKHVSF